MTLPTASTLLFYLPTQVYFFSIFYNSTFHVLNLLFYFSKIILVIFRGSYCLLLFVVPVFSL